MHINSIDMATPAPFITLNLTLRVALHVAECFNNNAGILPHANGSLIWS